MRIKKDDQVIVITGKDKGKIGKILKTYPKDNKVLVEGVNVATVSEKPSRKNPQGGIVKIEKPLDASNVMYYDTKLNKGTRVKYEVKDGKKVRVSVKSNEVID